MVKITERGIDIMVNDPTVKEVVYGMSKRKRLALFRIIECIAEKKLIKTTDLLVYERKMNNQEQEVTRFLIAKLFTRLGEQDEPSREKI
jgi:hypothetical protein